MDSYGIELEFELLWYDDWLEVNKLENVGEMIDLIKRKMD